jgi:hypothetical protein
MSCNNTNSTCSNCNHNYSSCNNKCAKCGCKDSFLTSPPPCPTPAGCPDPIPCQEVLASDCIIYTGPDVLCNGDIVVYNDATWTEVLEQIVDYFCLPPIPEITCNGDIVVTEDSSINEALEDIVSYFCLPPIPEILCGEDIVVTEDSSINEALEDIVSYICDNLTTANNGLTMSPTSNNVQLGGPLIQNTTITNSTFNLNINSTTVSALNLFKSIGNNFPTLMINDPSISTTSPAIGAFSNSFGFLNETVFFENTSTNISGGQVLTLKSQNNSINAVSPQLTTPTLYIESSKTASTTTQVALRVDNVNNINAGSGIAVEFANSDATPGTGFITNRLISKTVVNTSESLMTSEFVIQGKPSGIVDPIDHLTLKSTGQLQLNEYGAGTFTGIPTYNLSTTVSGDIIETVAGLFSTAFRGYISPDSFPTLTFDKPNSNISLGTTVVFDTTNGVIEYQIENGVNVTSQYNQITGVWTCPQTGKYDLNYNVYLSSPANTFGWGEAGGTFTIGITDPTGAAIIYCADTFTAVRNFYYDKLYMTGGMQGVTISANTQIVLKIQNLTGVAYTQIPSRGDNIDWAIRRVG